MIKHPDRTGFTYDTLFEQYTALNLPTNLLGQDRDFTIFNLNDLKRTYPFQIPVSRLNFFIFIFVKNGWGYHKVDDISYKIEPGTVYITNPGHWRSFDWHHADHVCLITLSESFLKENIHNEIFNEFPFLLSQTFLGKKIEDANFSEFELLYKQIKSTHLAKSAYRKRMVGSLFVVLLLKIKEHFFECFNVSNESDRSSAIVSNFKILLEKHYRDLATGQSKYLYQIPDYASKLQLHPNYLNSVIKIKTGRPISYWMAEKNITEARSMLINTNVSIKLIAYRLGFTRPTHFSSFFKRHTGYSPVEFRARGMSISSPEAKGNPQTML